MIVSPDKLMRGLLEAAPLRISKPLSAVRLATKVRENAEDGSFLGIFTAQAHHFPFLSQSEQNHPSKITGKTSIIKIIPASYNCGTGTS